MAMANWYSARSYVLSSAQTILQPGRSKLEITLTSNSLVAHPLPKVNLATSLKLAFLPCSPGRLPTIVAHRLSRYSPNREVHPEKAQLMMPGIRPIDANAEGKARAPAPMIVLARFDTEERMDA